MFDKSPFLPPVGSLREALFLTVQLRRMEADFYKTRLLAQGLVNMSEHGADAVNEVFKRFAQAALPFMEKHQTETDQKMKEAMEKEVRKGLIVFNTPATSPLEQRAKTMRLPDEYRRALNEKRKRP